MTSSATTEPATSLTYHSPRPPRAVVVVLLFHIASYRNVVPRTPTKIIYKEVS